MGIHLFYRTRKLRKEVLSDVNPGDTITIVTVTTIVSAVRT